MSAENESVDDLVSSSIDDGDSTLQGVRDVNLGGIGVDRHFIRKTMGDSVEGFARTDGDRLNESVRPCIDDGYVVMNGIRGIAHGAIRAQCDVTEPGVRTDGCSGGVGYQIDHGNPAATRDIR